MHIMGTFFAKTFLTLLILSSPSWATWGLVQHQYTTCHSGSSCTITLNSATGQNNLLALAFFASSNTSYAISSVTDNKGGTWAVCSNCNAGNSASGGTLGGAYNLSSVSNTTSVTLNLNSSESAQFVVEIIEYSHAGNATFDVSGGGTDTACSSCAGVALTLGHTADVIVQFASGKTNSGSNSFSAISGSYTTPFDHFNVTKAGGVAGWVNVGTTNPTTPNWTQTAGDTINIAVMAFTESAAITSLSPTSGPVGTSVTISGSNFGSSQGSSTVIFNGTSATPTSWSATSIAVPVPSGATTGNVVVTVGGQASNGVSFTVTSTPLITSLSPGSGPVGNSVTINGSNFGSTQGTSTVTFNGTAATPTSWNATSIVVPVPSGATTGNVIVTVGGVASNGASFTVTPGISSLSPASGPVGNSVTITGTNFGATQGTSTVTFNGTAATPTSWNATSIVVPVPSGATTGNVIVTVGGVASNGANFTVTPGNNSISLIQCANGEVDSVTTSVTVTMGQATIAGDLLAIMIHEGGNSTDNFTVSDNLSQTWTTPTYYNINSSYRGGLSYIANSASVTSVKVSYTTGGGVNNGSAVVCEFSGIKTSSPTDGSPLEAGTTSSVSSLTMGSISTSNPSDLLFYGVTVTGTSAPPYTGTAPCIVPTNGYSTYRTGICYDIVSTTQANASLKMNFNAAVTNALGIFRAFQAATSSPAPSISSLSPTSGPVGTSVTISGSNFGSTQGTSTVTFNGTAATPTSWSATSIVVPVPSGAITGNVIVTVGGAASNGVSFTVTPSITSLSPTSGPVGTSVTISGSNFGSTQGSSTVTFNGTVATPSSWSAASIVVPVPSSATNGNVVVTIGGVASNGVSFTVAPSISSLSPASGPVGISVTIGGSSFGSTQGTSTVTFNGTAATPTSWNAASIVVPVPSGATTGNVLVSVGGLASNGVSFTVTPGISSLSPTSGPVGTSVTITGTNFGSTQGTSTVTFNGTTATPSIWSPTSIVVPVPSGATNGNVVVTVGGLASNGVSFTVTPGISSLSPTSGPVGISVTITGTNFGSTQGTSTVTFNGTAATPTSWSATSIVVPVPSGATNGNVVVTVGGVASNGVSFSITPGISSLSPASGPAGSSVTISGSNFGSTQGTSTVTFNGTAATPTSWSATSITVPVPSGATTGNVVVTVGGIASNGISFTVTPAPSITSISPTSGAAGTSVTISGSNFGSTQGASTVTFNGTVAAINPDPTKWSATSIVVLVPSGATSGNVVVNLGGAASNGVSFTVTPGISSLSPASGPVGISVTISGSSFGATQGTSTVKFNGTAATPTSWSATSIAVPVPSGATSGNVVVTVGGQASNGVSFTVTSAPSITSLSPTSGPVSTPVTITGTNFGSTQGTSTVTFNGTAGTPTSWSATSIVVPVPSGAITGNVIVTVGGHASNGVSFTVAPAPSITSISPTSGAAGTSVTISGSNFGSTQGTSIVKFNGIAGSATSWSATSIAATAPAGVTTGLVTVTVSGQISNGVTFTVPGGTVSGTITKQSDGTAISGATVNLLQTGAIKASGTGNSSGAYSISNVAGGTYDVQVSASGYGTYTQSGIAVAGNGTTTINAALSLAGTVSGTVTQADGVTAISGAVVRVYVGDQTAASTTTSGSGTYTLSGLDAGTYSVEASATGFVTQTKTGVSVTANTTTTANFALPAAGAAVISYDYDELGRLVSVVDQAGDTATYSYDAVGNILSISRKSSSQLSIITFTPTSGPAGTTVTIFGTAFSSTASQDTVGFNGTNAAVSSATATQLVVSVPSGATSGPIAVTTPAGSVTSTASFTVTASNGAPTISSFSPTIATVGTALTVSGTNFDTTALNDRVTLNASLATVTSATSTSIATTVPGSATSGHIRIATPLGAAVSTQDLYIPWGSHVASDVALTARMTLNSTQPVSLAAGKIGLLIFDATPGQKISVLTSSGNFSSCTLYLFDPHGSQITSTGCGGASGFLTTQTLASNGTYTLGIDPGTSTGSMSLTLYSVTNLTDTITPGVAKTFTIGVPGQTDTLTFTSSATAGQQISVNFTNSAMWFTATLKNPDGSTLGSQLYIGTGLLGPYTVPQNGTLTLMITPYGASTGSVTATASLFSNLTDTITPGVAKTFTIGVPGQTDTLTFTSSATAGQQISVNFTNDTMGCYTAILKNPDGSTLGSQFSCGNFLLGPYTVPMNGTYTLIITPNGGSTGSVTATASLFYNQTGTITPGTPKTITINIPGQTDTLTFSSSATAGQSISVNFTNDTMGCYTATLQNPDGSTLGSQFSCGNFTLGPYTVPSNQGGIDTLVITPNGGSTGSVTATASIN